MRYASFVTALAILCGLTATVAAGDHAPGHSVNALGRWSGYGWGRGYHTQDGCQTCANNHSGIVAERYFDSGLNSEHEQPMPLLGPAGNEPAAKPTQPHSKSVLPTLKSTSPTSKKIPKADDARNSRHPAFPLRAHRDPLQPYPR